MYKTRQIIQLSCIKFLLSSTGTLFVPCSLLLFLTRRLARTGPGHPACLYSLLVKILVLPHGRPVPF